ncbi:MAG: hypothetical protein IKV41_06875 [Oscillospiraceae bacterium]|nr:hypothetical protein [Oscillospiraceae bacterium]
MKQYIHEFTVHNFETDFRGDVRISNLLKYAQHVATYHCEDLGIGRDYMLGLGKVFLLGKMRGVINRLPRSTEKLTVKTTPFEPVRAQYQRLIDFTTSQVRWWCSWIPAGFWWMLTVKE